MASALHLAPNLDSAVGHASISNQGVSAIPQPETVGQNVNQIQNAHEESQACMVSRKRDAEEAQEESHAKRLRTDAAEAVALVDSTSSPGEANAPPVGNPEQYARSSARRQVFLLNYCYRTRVMCIIHMPGK
ncbi:hypothetical protein MPER_09684 [Moniliophthora perniciosa FA553]|nr:hypothetical protein MPER_09684 [Moniliophthora perniciosa FA553]